MSGVRRHDFRLSDDGGLHFQAPLSASQDIRDPNHPVFAESESGKLLLSFQGRSASANGQWNPTAVFVMEILDDKVGIPVPLGNHAKAATALGLTGNIHVAWSAAGEQKSSVALVRGYAQ